jgi:hypothetical protein
MNSIYNKIFVFYPRGVRTGGPEALHQLVSTLRGLGVQAFLVPRPGTETTPRVEDYAHYDAPEVSAVEDKPGNAVITSEYVVHYLSKFKHADRFCWWLSIDNSSLFKEERQAQGLWESSRQQRIERAKLTTRRQLKGLKRELNGTARLMGEINHLAQSHYAWTYLFAKLNVLPTIISDFTPTDLIASVPPVELAERGATIAYNPKKAARITELIQLKLPDAEYIPLTGMTSRQVAEALSRSTIYLDLGYHPGKDRMPREAALCGAVSLVARRGSGAFHQDVPIPWEHKISPIGDITANTVNSVRRVLDDPASSWAAQKDYRAVINLERDTFEREVKSAFVDGKFELDVL